MKYIRVVCDRWLHCAGLFPVTDLFPGASWRDRVDGSSRLCRTPMEQCEGSYHCIFRGEARILGTSIKELIPTKFALVNARSLGNKTFILNDFIGTNKLDVFCISETWLKVEDSSPISELLPEGYLFINSPHPSGRGGGLMTIQNKNVQCQPLLMGPFLNF